MSTFHNSLKEERRAQCETSCKRKKAEYDSTYRVVSKHFCDQCISRWVDDPTSLAAQANNGEVLFEWCGPRTKTEQKNGKW